MSAVVQPAEDSNPIVLGGRQFRVVEFDKRTVVMDHYMIKLVRATGLDKVAPMDGDDEFAYMTRMQSAIIDSLRGHELVAALLLPVGKEEADWTPAMAQETAKHIGTLQEQRDREQVLQLCMEVVFGFFRQGLDWLQRSLRSLSNSQTEESPDRKRTQTSSTSESGRT